MYFEADYYPPGAYNDPAAPWNELEYSIPVAISVTLSTTAEVVGYSPDISGEELKQLVEEEAFSASNKANEIYKFFANPWRIF